MLDFVFPHNIISNPHACIKRAILSPFNAFVDKFNSKIVEQLPGESWTYWSTDYIESDLDQEDVKQTIATPDLLNSFEEPGIPAHKLTLKMGCICRFTRNFDASKGLTKNTRVIITKLLKYSVEVETLPDIVAGQTIAAVCALLHRVMF
jgi:ATP-dependent DNA helicase PIF1